MRNMKNLVLFLLFCLAVSCKNGDKAVAYTYDLVRTDSIKSFPLGEEVRYNAFYLYTFNEQGKEYLSFLNYRTNQILFYDLQTCEYLFALNLASEGPDGVAQLTGLYVKDLKNIYVSSYAYNGLMKVDTTGHIIQRIPYGVTDAGYKILPSYAPASHPYIAPVFIEDNMFITQPDVSRFCPAEETPLSIVIDTLQETYKGVPLTYAFLSEEELNGNDTRFSRIFNGQDFVYSFYVSEDIIVASINHSDVKRIQVKSQYINNPTERQEDTERGAKQNLELARYGDLIYDPYREVYYRFAYPKVNLEDDIRWWGKAVYGRKKFSVIVLNKEFQIIGETLFPEGIYNSYVFFVHKDGLYISRDYQMLYGNSEDNMTFELVKLVKKK